MSKEKIKTEDEIHSNPMLAMRVGTDTKLKEYLVDYVGTKFDKEEVTVNMIAEAIAADFPEFAFAYAEENYLRGYQQGLDDAQGLYQGVPEATDGTSK
ncbi:MAG: hypothetical protein CMF96_05415 [Candidatus Marinimicrobia bacterium]|nr:hypothetical protein [Candidatus Neomarinimicrobiota bacterium]